MDPPPLVDMGSREVRGGLDSSPTLLRDLGFALGVHTGPEWTLRPCQGLGWVEGMWVNASLKESVQAV